MSTQEVIHAFHEHEAALDDQFDDGLMMSYYNDPDGNGPVYEIVYDPTIDKDVLAKNLPKKWLQLEKQGKVKIEILSLQEYKILKRVDSPILLNLITKR